MEMNDILILSDDKKTVLSVIDKNVKTIVIPDGITEIGNGAFEECSSLQSIDIPNSVTEIGDYAFSGCSSLKSIDIPDGVTEISKSAFRGCKSLESISIRCKDIDNIKVENSPFDDDIFDDCILHIPSGTRWAYRHHPIFGKFKNIVTERFD